MMKASEYSGRVAVVTGGNRGIGFEVCRGLARLGMTVILTSRDQAKGRQAALRLASEGTVAFYPLDVTSQESVQALKDFLVSEYGRCDVLVNNAGVYLDKSHGALDVSIETYRQTLEVNTFGPLMTSLALIPLMIQNGYGRVVNITSGLGQWESLSQGTASYSLSKTALNALTVIMADATAGSNVLVNAVCPGWVRTDMGGPNAPRSLEKGAQTVIWLAGLPDGGPTGTMFRDKKEVPW